MRLDKFLAEAGLGSRSEVKVLLKKGEVSVNDEPAKDGKLQVNEQEDQIFYQSKQLSYQKFFYYSLNKPVGVVSATQDKQDKTVVDLLSTADFRADIFPVGRLDKDTEGLLLLTNDGALAHDLLSPRKHVEKEYFARIAGRVTEQTIRQFADGVTLQGEKNNPFTGELFIERSAEVSEIRLIIHRGVYHQVKRMFQAIGMEVIYLKRLRMGTLRLDENLKAGEYRELLPRELENLRIK